MKKLLPIIMLMMSGIAVSPVRADLTHRLTSSTQLSVDAGYTQVSRAGNSYSTSGSGVSTTITPSGGSAASDLGGISAVSTGGVATFTVPDATQTTAGNAFSYTNSLTTGDAIVTTAPTTGSTTAGYSNQYATAAGTGSNAFAEVTSAHGFAEDSSGDSLTAVGGAGSTVTTQFVSELSIR